MYCGRQNNYGILEGFVASRVEYSVAGRCPVDDGIDGTFD
jgi:hypothetical protein